MAQLSDADDPDRAQRAAARTCGTCSICCTVLRVDELAKPAGRDCRHQRGAADGAGCGIHADRPPVCRGYHCLWLQGGLGDADRPDRTGGIVDLEPRGLGAQLSIREIRAGAFDSSPALQAIAARHREEMPVRVILDGDPNDPDRPFRVLQAAGLEHRVAGERVEVWRDGEFVEEQRLGWAERLGRRISVWWRGRKLDDGAKERVS